VVITFQNLSFCMNRFFKKKTFFCLLQKGVTSTLFNDRVQLSTKYQLLRRAVSVCSRNSYPLFPLYRTLIRASSMKPNFETTHLFKCLFSVSAAILAHMKLLQPEQFFSRRDPHGKQAVKSLPEVMTVFMPKQRSIMHPNNLWL
jgi:hypothetical protein